MTNTYDVTGYTQDGHHMYDVAFSWVHTDETTELQFAFDMVPSADYPYVRQTAPASERQIATSESVGEATLDNWWNRSQASWHLGSGREWMDGSNDPSDMFRFNDSCNIEVAAPGQISIVREAELLSEDDATYSTSHMVSYFVDEDDQGVIFALGPTLTAWDSDGSDTSITTNLTGSASLNIKDLTTNGSQWFACDTNEIAAGTIPTGSGVVWWDTDDGTSAGSFGSPATGRDMRMVSAKERLFVCGIAGDNQSWFVELSGQVPPSSGGYSLPNELDLTEGANQDERDANGSTITDPGGTTAGGKGGSLAQGRTWMHPAPNWLWFDMCDGVNCVYAAGYAGDESAIYAASFDANAAPSVGIPQLVATLPKGEQIRRIESYMGTYLFIGTNAGFRVAKIRDDGIGIDVGPITFYTENTDGCWGIAPYGDSVIVSGGSTNYISTPGSGGADTADSSNCLVKVDLAAPIADSYGNLTDKYSWANYVMPAGGSGVSTRSARNVVMVGDTGRVAFNVKGSAPDPEGLYMEKAATRSAKGWLETGKIRMDTWEQKIFQQLKVFFSTVDGQVVIQYKTDRDTYWTTLGFPETDAAREWNGWASDGHPCAWIQYRFLLYRGNSDTTSTPVLTGWTVRSSPSQVGEIDIKMPLVLAKDYSPAVGEGTMSKNRWTYPWMAYLELAAKEQVLVKFENKKTNETQWCQIREVQYIQTGPDNTRMGMSYPSGLMYVTVRTVS